MLKMQSPCYKIFKIPIIIKIKILIISVRIFPPLGGGKPCNPPPKRCRYFKNVFINKRRFLIMRGAILSIRGNYCVNKKDSLLIRGRGVIRGF